MRAALGLLLFVSHALACDPNKRAHELADRASSEASKLENDAKSAAKTELDKGVVAAKRALFGLTDTGALSDLGKDWLSKQAPSGGGGEPIEATVAKGKQIAPVVVEADRVMNEAVDEDTAIEPIYQSVEPGKEAQIDASIKSMPRVEVIDGVTVGFRMLDDIETTKIRKERAVLVMWRKDTHLIGFLYRSKRTIDVGVVVRETPRLMKLMQAAAK